jgi:hypothetical protein
MTRVVHRGHFTTWPMSFSGARSLAAQDGQTISIGMAHLGPRKAPL